MALRIGRLRPLLQDENAENSVVSGKNPGAPGLGAASKGLGLKPQHQNQPVAERKKLSNITNQLLPKSGKGKGDPENVGGAKTASQGFSIKVDAEFAATKAGLQHASSILAPTARYPLKNITNGGNQRQEQIQDDPKLQKKAAEAEIQNHPTTKFTFPPSSALNLTEEMKKKAAEWAEEGIEQVHFSGKDMEELREKMEQQEMEKRLAAVFSIRPEIPFPKLRPSVDFSWGFPDVLELDILKDLDEDANIKYEGLEQWSKDTDAEEALLGYTDYLAVCSPPRFTEGWPQIREDAEI